VVADDSLTAVPTAEAGEHDFAALISSWLPLTYALNAITAAWAATTSTRSRSRRRWFRSCRSCTNASSPSVTLRDPSGGRQIGRIRTLTTIIALGERRMRRWRWCESGIPAQAHRRRAEHELDGATVVELLRTLELRHPEVSGWILDERGLIRRHINVFVNGERGDRSTAVRPRTAWKCYRQSQEAEGLTELLVGTKKACSGRRRTRSRLCNQDASVCGRGGRLRDPRSSQRAASRDRDLADLRTEDLLHGRRSRREWLQARVSPCLRAGSGARAHLGDRLRRSGRDVYAAETRASCSRATTVERAGRSTGPVEQPSRAHWQPGGAASACTRSARGREIQQTRVAVSAAGMWLTEDGGRSCGAATSD